MARKERDFDKTIEIMQLKAELAANKFEAKYSELNKKLNKLDVKQSKLSQ